MARISPVSPALSYEVATRPSRRSALRNVSGLLNAVQPRTPAPASSAVAMPTVASARSLLGSGIEALREALANLTLHLQPVRTLSYRGQPSLVASAQGSIDSPGTYSTLAATQEVNGQVSTVRASGSALGLDVLSPASASQLSTTNTLGMDVTSPEGPSALDSSAVLGLDVTSPLQPSRLGSANPLGLDVTSPEAASQLQSSATLGLDVSSPEAHSRLTSTGEANAAPSSYGVVQATFDHDQTSRGTLSGVYAGTGLAANATSLTLKITSGNATMGATPVTVTVKVTDQNNTVIGTYTADVAAGQAMSLGGDTGLSISFAAGSIKKNAITTFSVDKNTPTNVDPTATFNNADVNLRPRFENNAQVTAGSFTVNGTTVNVLANDTINSVLARINSTVSGVTASFSGDKVTLETTSNSEDDIVLAGDTSGFLSALKLSGATTVKGNIHDDEQVLAKTSQFSSVTSGSFTVNGVSIAVDRNTDTLQSVVARINSAGAGVTAEYDSEADKIVLNTLANTEDDIAVEDDTTGFVTAAHLSTGNTVKGNIKDDVQVLSKTSQFGSVASGSFTINGVSISVDRDTDTVQSLVARINSAGAGVTAEYDAVADKIQLTTLANTEDDIAVDDDTTGFLAAAQLSTGNTVKGNIADDVQVLAKTSQFGSVTSGTFTINGVSIAVDRDTDTLQSIVARINDAGAGVTATYDSEADKIHLATLANTEDDIAVEDDTTGFLAAAHLSTGNTVKGNIKDDEQVLAKTSQFGSVTSGSFTVNGVSISVDRNTDTVQSVVARINSAGAGVTAEYDSEADKITLTTLANTEDDIAVEDDTTGFLAAAQLSTGNTVKGNIQDDLQVVAKTSQFGSVTSGSFTVNDVSIAVDRDTDTLQSLLSRINDAGAGVTASYDLATDRMVFTPDTPGATLVLEDDTSGFLAAAHVATGAGGTQVDRDAAFNAIGLDSPFFELGRSVTAGSFDVNGVSISVEADDNLSAVLAKISASAAGVKATFNPSTEKVVLTAKNPGETAVTIGNDTSGFLAAVKLDETAASTAGISTLDSALDQSPTFASVQSGTITINGQSVAVNPALHSLSQVIASLDGLNGVIATADPTTGQVVLKASQEGGNLDITDTSGLLSALGMQTGTFQSKPFTLQRVEVDTGRTALDDPTVVAASLSSATERVGEALDQLHRAGDAAPLFKYRAEAAVRTALASIANTSGKGLSLDENNGAFKLAVDADALAEALQNDPSSLDPLWSGSAGLPEALDTLLQTYDETASTQQSPDEAAAASAGNQTQPVLGDKTKAELERDGQERLMSLVNSLTSGLPASGLWSNAKPALASSNFLTDDKVRQTYGLATHSPPTQDWQQPSSAWASVQSDAQPFLAARLQEAYGLTNELRTLAMRSPLAWAA